MKKERNLLILITVLLIAYFVMLFFVPWFGDEWLASALYFLSVYMFIKAYYFRSDSSLFFALVFLQSSVLMLESVKSNFSLFQLSTIFNLLITIAFFVDYLVFRSKFLFYSFLTNFFTSLPIFLYAFNCISLVFLILLLCGVLLLFLATILKWKYEKI